MFRPEVWFVSTLFCCGIIASMLFTSRSAPSVGEGVDLAPTPTQPLSQLVSDPEALPPPSRESAAELGSQVLPLKLSRELLDQVDRELILGKYRVAKKWLESNLNGPAESIEPEFNIRWALSEELQGTLREAESRYRAVLANRPEPALEMLALSGLARVWMRQGKFEAAQSLLADLFLQSAKLEDEVDSLWGEVMLVLAHSYALPGSATPSTSRLPWHVLSEAPQPDLDNIVAFFRRAEQSGEVVTADQVPETGASQSNELPAPGIHVIQNVSADPELIFLDANVSSQSLIQVLAQLSQPLNSLVNATPEAREILTARSKMLTFRGRSLATVLDSLLMPLGLLWEINEGQLNIVRGDQWTAERQVSARRQAASRLNQIFLLEFSTDSRVPIAQLSQAELAWRQGDIEQAAADYQALVNSKVMGEVLASACLNLAWLNHSVLGRDDIALEWAGRALDQTLENDKQALAQSLMAHLHLQHGRFDSAIKDAGRAVGLDPVSPAAEQAALILARAYLLRNQPAAANRAIFEAREAFQNSGNRALGGFLSSYARYLAKSSDTSKKRELESLLNELSHVMSLPDLLPPDQYLVARVLQEMGIDELAMERWLACLQAIPPPYWFHRVQFELAVARDDGEFGAENLKALDELTQQDDISLAVQARIQMARVMINQRQWQQAIDICRSLPIADLAEAHQRAVLKIMGNAYSHLDQPYSASLCFSGVLPQPVAGPEMPNQQGEQ